MKLVGIVGFKGSGKDTAAQAFLEDGYVKYSFAGALKDVLSVTFGWDREMMEGLTKESREWREQVDHWWATQLSIPDFSPRRAMQYYGTDVLRKYFHDRIWILSLQKRILLDNPEKVVITDCRFRNELDMIREMGGTVIRVRRGNEPEWYLTALEANLSKDNTVREHKAHIMETTYKNIHKSEWDWIGYDIDRTIDNNRSVTTLHRTMRNVLDQL